MALEPNHWTNMLQDWNGHKYFQITLILLIAWSLFQFIRYIIPRLLSKIRPNYRFYVLPWIPLLRLIIILGAMRFIIPLIIKPTRENLLIFFGTVGLAIGFAFKDYISCLIAGFLLIIERPYQVGDWIQIGDTYGEVISLGLRTVKLQTSDDNAVTIPHSLLWTSSLSNSTSGQRDLLCIIDFFVHSNHDRSIARQTLFDVAVTSAYLNFHRPAVVVMRNDPIGVYYKVKAYPMDAREQFLFIADVTERGQFALHEIGLSLVSAPASVSS
jgi:small conductance mechanosensitive channel